MNKICYIVLVFLVFCCPFWAKAQTFIGSNAPFWEINPDPAAMGMGLTSIATEGTAASYSLNPAKMVFQQKGVTSASTYSPWASALRTKSVLLNSVIAAKISPKQAISVNGLHFNWLFYPTSGLRNKQFGLSYAYKLNAHFSVGANLASYKITPQNLNPVFTPVKSFSGGIGVYYQKESKTEKAQIFYSAGAAITNIGPKISVLTAGTPKNYIYTNFGIGASAKILFHNRFFLNPALDFNKFMVPSSGLTSQEPYLSGILKSGFDADIKQELYEIKTSIGLQLGKYVYFNDKKKEDYFRWVARMGYFHENKLQGNRKLLTLGFGSDLQVSKFVIGANTSIFLGVEQNAVLGNTMSFGGNLGYLF